MTEQEIVFTIFILGVVVFCIAFVWGEIVIHRDRLKTVSNISTIDKKDIKIHAMSLEWDEPAKVIPGLKKLFENESVFDKEGLNPIAVNKDGSLNVIGVIPTDEVIKLIEEERIHDAYRAEHWNHNASLDNLIRKVKEYK